MIYAIGNPEYYEPSASRGRLYKSGKTDEYPGGPVWQTREEAQKHINRDPGLVKYRVYGLEADWETDTEQGIFSRRLLRDTLLVALD